MNHKKTTYKGLQFLPVWFEDRSLTSPDYFQISEFPNKLTAGKNLFKLRGHPTNIRVNSVLNIEILDYNQDPIYFEALSYLDDDKSRIIAIYIYDDTAAGDCTITMMAEAEDVPENWRGLSNIRWTRTVSVNPQISNDSEIIFESIPELSITEQIGPHLDRIYSGSIQFPTLTDGTVKYFSYNGQPAIELSGGKFTKDMSNGTITINTPSNPSPTAAYTPDTIKFTSGIKKVLSPTLALLDTEYEVYTSSSLSSHIYYSFDPSAFSLTYESTPTYVQTQNSESYALLEIKGLQPSTGDVSRVKLFMNNKGTVGTWEMINDIELTETEIFVANTASLYPDTSIGLFMSQSIIDDYWEGHTYQGFNETTSPTLTWNTASLNNAMQIVNYTNISAKNAVSVAQIKSSYNGLFIEKSDYKIIFDAIGTKNTYDNAILSVYVSGSAFSMDYTDYLNQELPKYLGKRIGQLTIDNSNQRFDDKVFSFTADKTGTATLLFVVESGDWQIADIRTTSDNEIGYTPAYTRIKTLVPTAHKSNNQVSFKTEYYNVAGVKSKQISYTYNKTWEGGNRYIDGNYSMLTGSLYVADSLNSGVAISGYKNSGFIRSLGYEGFSAGAPGFLLWSGSAMSGSLGTKGGVIYSGVGLELYADTNNYLRYSTTDSELDIKTNKIFIGNNSTFISASNGNLQISSSNFKIDASGNVTLSGTVNITSGTGFETPASVSASINAATSSLSSSLNITITNNSQSAAGALTSVSSSLNNTINSNSSSISDRIVTDINNKIVKPNDTPTAGNGLYLSQRYLGYYASSEWKSYISSSGEFLFQKDLNNRISFGNNSFVLKVSDTAIISGSNINLITPSFFFGGATQYISGSGGNIAISSSNFHLAQNGDVTLRGTVNITGGSGFETPASVSASINAATSSLSSSLNQTITSNSSSLAGSITSNSSSLAGSLTSVSSSTAARIVTDANNKIIKTNDAPSGGSGLYLSSKYLGYYDGSAWNAYISSSGAFLFKRNDNNLISFDNNAFVLKVSDTVFMSGSSINLLTPNFFFGSNTQYISGSGGNIAISSSKFHLDAGGNVTLTGNVNITGGSGFETPASVSASINAATSSLSSSLNTAITNNSSSAAGSLTSVSSSTAARIVTDANNKIIKINDVPSSPGLHLTANYLGYYRTSPTPGWNAYVSASGDFLFKKDDNNQLSFANNSMILKVSDTVFMSGSSISLLTPNFYFGGTNQYISGSGGNISISSSRFHLAPNGDVTLTGNVNITGGSGFATPTSVSASINAATSSLSSSLANSITSNSSSAAGSLTSVSSSTAARIVTDANNKIIKINDTPGPGNGLYLSSNYLGYYNGSAWNAYISQSGEFKFQKDSNNLMSFGNNSMILKVTDTVFMSGSNINLITPNFFFGNDSNFISGSNGNIRISGSNVLVTTPTFLLGNQSNLISGSNGNILISGSNVLVTTPTFLLGNQSNFISGSSNGIIKISGSNVSIETPTFLLGNTLNFISGSNGNIRISGSNVNVQTSNFLLGNNSNLISGSNGNIRISGSNVSIETPSFFFGNQTTQYISGSNGFLQISSSNFHLKANGQVTASGIDIAGVSKSNIIQNKTIVITTANKSLYVNTIPEVNTLTVFTPEYEVLVLDGTNGGEVVQRVKLDYDSPIKSAHFINLATINKIITSYPIAIGGIKLPNISDTTNSTCTVEITAGRSIYMNNSVGSFNNWYDYVIPNWDGAGWLQDTVDGDGTSWPGYDAWWY